MLALAVQAPGFPRRAEVVSVTMPKRGREVPASVWLQSETAPILYIIPGIGSHRRSTTPVALAEMAWQRGYSVAIVTSPFHAEFLENGATYPYPGYTPQDAADLHEFFTLLHAELDARQTPAEQRLRERVDADLAALDVVVVDGWVMARMEADLCAAVYLDRGLA